MRSDLLTSLMNLLGASEDVIRLWLEFNSGNVEKQVRIGWIKLTE